MHRLWRLRRQHLVVDAQLTDDGETGVEVASSTTARCRTDAAGLLP